MTVSTVGLVVAIAALAGGTFAIRLAGPVLRARIEFSPRMVALLETAAVVVLVALVAITGLTSGHGFAGVARPAGVVTGGVLAARGAPFFVVVLAAAASTALLRWLHIP
ncbi:MAG: AzlD domain-containing protein [Streptosporangiaceae bacterium]